MIAVGEPLKPNGLIDVVAVEDVRAAIERLHKDCPHAGKWSNPAWHAALDAVVDRLDLGEGNR